MRKLTEGYSALVNDLGLSLEGWIGVGQVCKEGRPGCSRQCEGMDGRVWEEFETRLEDKAGPNLEKPCG